jgi:hypothetical protein
MAKKDSNKGKIKIVNKSTREERHVKASDVRKFDTDEWDVYTFAGTKASIEYLKRHNLIR